MPAQPHPKRKEKKMINVCSSTKSAYCLACPHVTACFPDIQPAAIAPTFKTMINEHLKNEVYALFEITADPDGCPAYNLIGVYGSISDAGSQISGLYTIIDRATLDAQTDDRHSIPYDFIIEPMRMDEPTPAHIYHACDGCNITHNMQRVCMDCSKYQ